MNNIKMLRERCELTQVELAGKMEVSQQAVTKWETGDSLPRADKLLQLSKILGCTVDELLNKNVE